jgi:hypothetical protein
MPPKHCPTPPQTVAGSKRSTQHNPVPQTLTDDSNNPVTKKPGWTKEMLEVRSANAQPLKKGDRSCAIAVAKIVDSPEIIDISPKTNRSTPKKSTTTGKLSASTHAPRADNCDKLPTSDYEDDDDNNGNDDKSINSVSAELYSNMHPIDLHYLTKIPNEAQYPAARCAMGDNVYMYSLSMSLGIESMNRMNMEARKATAVDMLNATMLLIHMESAKQFKQYKHQAHKTLMPLTPRGMDLMGESFKGVESIDYSYVLADMELFYQCNISKIIQNSFV